MSVLEALQVFLPHWWNVSVRVPLKYMNSCSSGRLQLPVYASVMYLAITRGLPSFYVIIPRWWNVRQRFPSSLIFRSTEFRLIASPVPRRALSWCHPRAPLRAQSLRHISSERAPHHQLRWHQHRYGAGANSADRSQNLTIISRPDTEWCVQLA